MSNGGFVDCILADLTKQGFTGDALLEKFKEEQAKIRPAVEELIAEADNVAAGNGEYYTYDEVFDLEDK